MSDNGNPLLGAKLVLDFDKTGADSTAKVLQDIYDKTKKLAATNTESAAAFDKAFNASRKAAEAAKQNAGALKTVDDVLKQIARQKALDELANKWAKVARTTKDAAAAQKGLQKDLEALNASQREIEGAAGDFAQGGGGAKNRLSRLGSEIRQLPSIQTGLGFGTDAIGNILRVGGAITGISEKSADVLKVAALLTPVLGANAAGYAALIVVASAFIIPLAAIVLAFKAAGDEAARQGEVVTGILNAQRETRKKINDGATTEDLTKENEKLTAARKDEADKLKENQALYDAQFKQQDFIGRSVGEAAQVLSGAEQSLADDLNTGTKMVSDYDAAIAENTRALNEGETAANDAAEAEEKLKEARLKALLSSAAAAGQEVQARTRADKATFEQNESRLTAIDDEKEAIQAQLDVLSASGDTSEEVTAQIAALTGQLGALGKESAYITDTALAASKARDAEKKAIKDAEKAREEALRTLEQADKKRLAAGQKYSETLIDIATKAADAAEDALRGLEDKLAANELSFGRDIDKLSRDANTDRLEAEIKVQAEEAADLREHQRKLESIRDDALADEDDALKKRDFLSAARIREATNQKIEAENKAFADGQTEKQIADDDARRKEDRELDNARQERLRQLQQQNDDARTAYDMRLRDDEIAQDRARRDAGTNRDRELAAAQELADSVLKIKGLQAQAELQLAGSVLSGIQAMAGGFQAPQQAFNGQGGVSNSTFNSSRTIGSLSIPINGATSAAQIQQQMLLILGQVGLMPN